MRRKAQNVEPRAATHLVRMAVAELPGAQACPQLAPSPRATTSLLSRPLGLQLPLCTPLEAGFPIHPQCLIDTLTSST